MKPKFPDINGLVELIWSQKERSSVTAVLERGLCAQGFDLRDLWLLERFDAIKTSVSRKIRTRIAECDERGIAPRFRFSGADSDELVFQSDAISESVKAAAVKDIRNLSWRNFERVCCYVLQISGVDKCRVMRGSKEGGIDIFGMLDVSQFLHPAAWKGSRLRVFCQVKKSRVGEPVVRLFNNDMRELYEDTGRAFSLLPAEMKALKSIVIRGIFSASGFTGDAENFAKAHGFLVVDPEGIIEVLLKSGRNMPGLITGGVLHVDEKLFEENSGDGSEQHKAGYRLLDK
jgi:hypothetical protein